MLFPLDFNLAKWRDLQPIHLLQVRDHRIRNTASAQRGNSDRRRKGQTCRSTEEASFGFLRQVSGAGVVV